MGFDKQTLALVETMEEIFFKKSQAEKGMRVANPCRKRERGLRNLNSSINYDARRPRSTVAAEGGE